MTDKTVGFIGLGNLGAACAANLVDRGYAVRVWNRTASKADALVERGAERAETPADVITPGGIVISLVWDDKAVDDVVTSGQFLDRLGPGGVHVSMSTISPESARRIATLHDEHGASYVEAPIFGRPQAALDRGLWIPIAGPAAAKARVKTILDDLGAKGVFDFGERIGAAVMVKLAGNFLIVSQARAFDEAVAVARANDVDPKPLLEMLTSTLFNSPLQQFYGKRIIDGAQPMRGGIPEKDIGLMRDAADKRDVPTPLADELAKIVKA